MRFRTVLYQKWRKKFKIGWIGWILIQIEERNHALSSKISTRKVNRFHQNPYKFLQDIYIFDFES